jgi:hypothetical protein
VYSAWSFALLGSAFGWGQSLYYFGHGLLVEESKQVQQRLVRFPLGEQS